MKKRLLIVLISSVMVLLAMEQRQQQDPMVKVQFGTEDNASTIDLPRSYVELSVTLKNQLLELSENILVIPSEYTESFNDLKTYFPLLLNIVRAQEKDEITALREQLVDMLLLKSHGANNTKLITLGNLSDFLEIPELISAVLSAYSRKLLEPSVIDQFLRSEKPHNGFELNKNLLTLLNPHFVQPALDYLSVKNNYFQQHLPSSRKMAKSVAWSPDGTKLAVGFFSGIIELWQQVDDSWNMISSLDNHNNSITALGWSADGTILVSGSVDGKMVVWNLVGQEFKAKARLHDYSYSTLALSPDGSTIACGLTNGTIVLWEQNDGLWQDTGPLPVHEALTAGQPYVHSVISLAWSPDGTMLASGSNDQSIKLWNRINGVWKAVITLRKHASYVRALAWSKDGKMLASGSGDGAIILWQEIGGRWQAVAVLKGHMDSIASLRWSPDGRTLASGSDDGSIKLWLQVNGPWQTVVTLPGAVRLSDERTRFTLFNALAWSPNGATLSIAEQDIILWGIKLNAAQHLLRSMSFAQSMLLFCAYQRTIQKEVPLDIAEYQNLQDVYQSFADIDGKNYLEFIKPLVFDSRGSLVSQVDK